MKVAFITIHVGNNFGSVLQTIATSSILEKLGYDSICINYIPDRVTESRYWHGGFSNGLRFLRRFLYFPIHIISKNNYLRYLKKYCSLSKPIYNGDDFAKLCPIADYYMTGSDQVWNYKHNEGIDKHYFFDGISGKKIAFASSIGMTELPEEYATYMKNALKSYHAISVREASAVQLLQKWGINSIHLLDPTLVLDKDTWKKYASRPLFQNPYLFVYLPYNIEKYDLIYESIKRIARKKNLKIVTYSYDFFKNKDADKTILFANPGDILSLILHAECVVTNSFHGTAFSINLNKQFWVYMPSKFSTRLLSLIGLCGLNGRMLDNVVDDDRINENIDFSKANQVLDGEREKARSFLKNALS